MNKFTLPNVKDMEVNRVLRQVQDALNTFADSVANESKPLKQAAAKTVSAVNQISARLNIVEVASEVSPSGSYTHTQGTPSANWTVVHHLGYYPAVTVTDSLGEEVIGDIVFIDANALTISFSGAFSGHAYVS